MVEKQFQTNTFAIYTTAALIACLIPTTSTSPSGLQSLLNICPKFGFENDIYINQSSRDFYLKCPDIYMNLVKLAYVKKTIFMFNRKHKNER